MIIVAALVLAAGWNVWPRLWAPSGLHKHYLHQAHAFLQGRLDIEQPFGDVATYNGRYYVVFPPFPALLITPLVALFGPHTRTTLVSLVLTALNFFVLRGVLRRLGVERDLRRWLLAGFFLGTAYTTSMFQTYESWHFAHLVAVTCLLLAIYEVLGRGRGVLVGLCCGLAFLSRHLCVYAALFLAVALWQRRRGGLALAESRQNSATGGRDAHPTRRDAHPVLHAWRGRAALTEIAHGVGFLAALGLCGGVYLYLNWRRFGNPFDTGYAYIPLKEFLAERVADYGLFHSAYVPFNLAYLFLQGPHISFGGPAVLNVEGVDRFGTSITFASPFVFFALLARWNRPLLWGAWLSIVLPIVHMVFYYSNGATQTNAQRFTLDFLPILMLLVALGARRAAPTWWKVAIGYSVALNAVSLFLVDLLKRLTTSV
jgi:hypothetical protein